ncbi:General transcription factor IIF subunit 2 [Blomia tropicalis]|nr:General transcription factor IIF subunit 2 [Blomia tropicalis]
MSNSVDLDCNNAGRGVWLVKVPKYISQRWEKQKPMTEVGRLKITTDAKTGKPEILFNLSEEILKTDTSTPASSTSANVPKATQIPSDHKFAISDIQHQTLAVFSQDDNKYLAMEGTVVQKGECQPIANAHYMKLKRESIRIASQPTKVVQKIDRAVNNFKPINAHRSEPYLKEILKEICHYNAKNPHKNMWELKPQFRHYKKESSNN